MRLVEYMQPSWAAVRDNLVPDAFTES
jgi:hypothetical protein